MQDFTYRNLARVVFDSFAISTTELANEFGVSNHRILKALKRYPAIFCGDSYEESGGVTSRQGHREGGGYGAILWQCWKTYDDHQIDEVYQDLANEGVELDAVIGGKNAGS